MPPRPTPPTHPGSLTRALEPVVDLAASGMTDLPPHWRTDLPLPRGALDAPLLLGALEGVLPPSLATCADLVVHLVCTYPAPPGLPPREAVRFNGHAAVQLVASAALEAIQPHLLRPVVDALRRVSEGAGGVGEGAEGGGLLARELAWLEDEAPSVAGDGAAGLGEWGGGAGEPWGPQGEPAGWGRAALEAAREREEEGGGPGPAPLGRDGGVGGAVEAFLPQLMAGGWDPGACALRCWAALQVPSEADAVAERAFLRSEGAPPRALEALRLPPAVGALCFGKGGRAVAAALEGAVGEVLLRAGGGEGVGKGDGAGEQLLAATRVGLWQEAAGVLATLPPAGRAHLVDLLWCYLHFSPPCYWPYLTAGLWAAWDYTASGEGPRGGEAEHFLDAWSDAWSPSGARSVPEVPPRYRRHPPTLPPEVGGWGACGVGEGVDAWALAAALALGAPFPREGSAEGEGQWPEGAMLRAAGRCAEARAAAAVREAEGLRAMAGEVGRWALAVCPDRSGTREGPIGGLG